MNQPTISVIVVAHRRTAFVREALVSVLSQRSDDLAFDVVLLADEIDAELTRWLDDRSVAHPPVGTGNWGDWVVGALPSLRGEVLCLLDDDDLFVAGKLAAIAEIFRTHPTVGYYHNRVERFEDGEEPREPPRARTEAPVGPTVGWVRDAEKGAAYATSLFWRRGGFNLSSMAVRRALVEERSGLLRSLSVGHSLALYFGAWCGPWDLYFDPRVLTRYRRHAGNQSVPAGESLRAQWLRASREQPLVATDAERLAEYIEGYDPRRASADPVRSVGRRHVLLRTLAHGGASRREILRELRAWVGMTPARVTWDHRGLVGLALLALLAPSLPGRVLYGPRRSAPSPGRAA